MRLDSNPAPQPSAGIPVKSGFSRMLPTFPHPMHRKLAMAAKTALTRMKQLFNLNHVDG